MVVVCGEALIDVIRSSEGTERGVPGGGPFNTARALARLGVPTGFIGKLSTDSFGRELGTLLAADGVSLKLAATGPEKTTIAFADVDEEGSAKYQFLVTDTSVPNLTAEEVPDHLARDVIAIHLGSLGLVLDPMADTLLGLIDRNLDGRLVMVDPNIRVGLIPDHQYRARLARVIACSSIVKASDSDVEWLYPGVAKEEVARRLHHEGVALVVVTLGGDGAFAAHRDFQVTVGAPRVEVVDTIGAGDAFGAALLAWLYDHGAIRPDLSLEREQLEDALRYACLAAAITCSRPGADPPWKQELSDRRATG